MKRFNETYGKRKFLSRNEWADTYKAINGQTEEMVIVKVLTKKSNDEEYIKNLCDEVNIIKKIDNPNLIHINNMFQYVAYGKTYYYIESEYFKGITLKEKIANEKLWEKEAIEIIKDIANGINELHHEKLSFNIVNMENILINPTNTVKINTLSYLENKEFILDEEENKVEFNPQKDIYDLGIMLYTLLSGKTVFKKSNYKKDIKDETLAKIIEKATNKEKTPNYSNMNRFIIDLQSYLSYGVIKEDTVENEEKKVKPKRKKGKAKKVIGTCALITVISGAGIYGYDFIKDNNIDLVNMTKNIFKIEGKIKPVEENNKENKENEEIKENTNVEEQKTENNKEDKVENNKEKVEESKDKNDSSNNSTASNKEDKKDSTSNKDKNSSSNNTKKPGSTTNNESNSTSTSKPSSNATTKPATTTTNKPSSNEGTKPSTTTTTKPSNSTTTKPNNTTSNNQNSHNNTTVKPEVPDTTPTPDNSNNSESNNEQTEAPSVEAESE